MSCIPIFKNFAGTAQLKNVNAVRIVKLFKPLIIDIRYYIIQDPFAVFYLINRILQHVSELPNVFVELGSLLIVCYIVTDNYHFRTSLNKPFLIKFQQYTYMSNQG